MNFIKIILAAAVLILALMLAYSVVGIFYTALWYLFLLGIVAAGGGVAYKLLKNDDSKKLADKTPIAIAELDNADRTLEEYKQKYLPK